MNLNTIFPPDISIDVEAANLRVAVSRLREAQKNGTKEKIGALFAGALPLGLLCLGSYGSYLLASSSPLKALGIALATLFSAITSAKASDYYADSKEAEDRGQQTATKSVKNGSLYGSVNLVKRAFKRIAFLQWLSTNRKERLQDTLVEVAKFHQTDLASLLSHIDSKINQAAKSKLPQAELEQLTQERAKLALYLTYLG